MLIRAALLSIIGASLWLRPAPANASHGSTTRVSVTSTNHEANAGSSFSDISADGRYVAFNSWASNLVPGDTNRLSDVFVHDRLTGLTELVSIADDGEQGDDSSYLPSISADGRYVAFQSRAGNLVDPERNLFEHSDGVFVRDRLAGRTVGVSIRRDGRQGTGFRPAISPDGGWVAYYSNDSGIVTGKDSASAYDVYLHSLESKTTTRIVCDDRFRLGELWAVDVSADGLMTAFECTRNLVPGGAPNETLDVYLFDRVSGETLPTVPHSSKNRPIGQSYGPSLSADGSVVAFVSGFDDLVEGDTNRVPDVFVYDIAHESTERASISSSGEQGQYSALGGLYAIFPSSFRPALSPDGRYVAFVSAAANLVSADTNMVTDAFVHDRLTLETKRVSVSTYGTQADADLLGTLGRMQPTSPLTIFDTGEISDYPAVANTGAVSFHSYATNLVHGDTNGTLDIFVQDPSPRPYDCGDGYAEGPVSGPLHGVVAPHSGPAGVLPRTVGCGAAAAGL